MSQLGSSAHLPVGLNLPRHPRALAIQAGIFRFAINKYTQHIDAND